MHRLPPMRSLLEGNDWTATTVGPRDAWPPTLRTIVDMMLGSPLPMALLWGPDGALLYNDAFASLIGRRHPLALGRPARDALGSPELRGTLAAVWSGEAEAAGTLTLPLVGPAVRSPVLGEDGALAGILMLVAGASGRRDAILLHLEDAVASLTDREAIEAAAARRIGEGLGATRAWFMEIEDQREVIVRQDFAHGVASIAGRYRLIDFGAEAADGLRRGEVAFTDDRAADFARYSVVIGRRQDGRLTAAFAVQRPDPAVWAEWEIELVREGGRRTWAAIDRARAALLQKKELRRSLQHRFKNDLQLIASLLNLQSKDVDESRVSGLLRKSRDRVYAMGAVYEALWRSQGPGGVDLRAFARRLVPELARFHGGAQRVEIQIEVQSVMIEPESAAALGLLLNELVSNVCVHAFPGGSHGEARVCLEREDGNLVLTVTDTGLGIPTDVSFDAPQCLGLRLVHMLARQLGGEVKLIPSSGARVEARFPATQGATEEAS